MPPRPSQRPTPIAFGRTMPRPAAARRHPRLAAGAVADAAFLSILTRLLPGAARPLIGTPVFEEHAIATTGDAIQDRRLADIGGKGLFAKEIHEALLDRRVDFAVHSLKDLETELPPGIVLACTLKREDARDALFLGPDAAAPRSRRSVRLPAAGALVGTSSVRRQAQLLHARPDLRDGR